MPPTRPSPRTASTSPLPAPLPDRFRAVRAATARLSDGLSDADATLQSMPDASPAKWHLAHTSWFFEAAVLADHADYNVFDPAYHHLFNSYYVGLGSRHARPERGLLSRPSLSEVLAYRAHVEAGVEAGMAAGALDETLIELGLAHEAQHQELLLTDILHAFSRNPLEPAYKKPEPLAVGAPARPLSWQAFPGGVARIGVSDGFDCEGPPHDVLLAPFEIADRAVTCGEWAAFVDDRGYEEPLLWLSDGWDARQREAWTGPLYWRREETGFSVMTLRGRQDLDESAPVSHLSFFEADAYARWAGARLPTEAEWEHAAAATRATQATRPNDLSTARLRPARQADPSFLGDVWEWTNSAYLPYPGFKPREGAVSEYNGKFMSGQMVVRGGSCLTPAGTAGVATRSFFAPDKRWQVTGLRLARNA